MYYLKIGMNGVTAGKIIPTIKHFLKKDFLTEKRGDECYFLIFKLKEDRNHLYNLLLFACLIDIEKLTKIN